MVLCISVFGNNDWGTCEFTLWTFLRQNLVAGHAADILARMYGSDRLSEIYSCPQEHLADQGDAPEAGAGGRLSAGSLDLRLKRHSNCQTR
jgi:hypothetical protein